MVTESFQEYKGYVIRLRFVTNNGAWFAIIKHIPHDSSPDGSKKLYLVKRGFVFMSPEKLLNKAVNYIDNHSDNLIKRFNEMTNL